jgi:hypothetical protein
MYSPTGHHGVHAMTDRGGRGICTEAGLRIPASEEFMRHMNEPDKKEDEAIPQLCCAEKEKAMRRVQDCGISSQGCLY